MKRFLVLAGLMAIGLASLASPQQQGPNIQTLAVKKVVRDRLTASLAEPFVGVRTGAGVTEGLFPIRATGVSTEPIRKADYEAPNSSPSSGRTSHSMFHSSPWTARNRLVSAIASFIDGASRIA